MTPASGSAVTQAFSWDVHGAVSLKPGGRSGAVGSPALVQLTAADALSGCTLQFSASGLPPGLSMTSCGKIIGWPRAYGQYQVHVTASDSAGPVATAAFGWRVYGARNAGPTGIVRLNRYRCLDAGAKATVVGGTCGRRASKWTVVPDGTLRDKNSCLVELPTYVTIGSCSHGDVGWQLGGGSGALTSGLANVATGRRLSDLAAPGRAREWAPRAATTVRCGAGSLGRADRGWRRSATAPRRLSRARPGDPTGERPLVREVRSAQTWTVQPTGQVQIGKYCLDVASGPAQTGRAVVLNTCGQATEEAETGSSPAGHWACGWSTRPRACAWLTRPTGPRAAPAWCSATARLSDPGVTWRVS